VLQIFHIANSATLLFCPLALLFGPWTNPKVEKDFAATFVRDGNEMQKIKEEGGEGDRCQGCAGPQGGT
jgi:hypothetical protein